MKLALFTLALSWLAGSALAAPAQEMPSQADAAAGSVRKGGMTNCAAYRLNVAVDATLRFITGVKILPDPNGETLCLRLRHTLGEKKQGKGKRSDGVATGEFRPFGFLFGKKDQNKDGLGKNPLGLGKGGLGKNPFGLGKDGKNLDFLKALKYGFQLDKKLRSGQKVDLEKELQSQFGKGSDVGGGGKKAKGS